MIEKLLKLLKIKFAGEIPLKDGTMVYVDGDVSVGASVYVQSPDGKMPLPDGDYELESGDILSAKDGKITAITQVVETPEEPDNTTAPPIAETMAIEVPLVEPVIEPIVEPITKAKKEKVIEPIIEPIVENKEPEIDLKASLEAINLRINLIESKLSTNDELEKIKADIEFIKNKTLVTELKKSKDVEPATITRMEILKNLKNNNK
jgi:hypothetical protein